MSKCDVNVQSLKQIRSKVASTLRTYLKQGESVSTLKENMTKLFNDIAEQYSLAGVADITNAIYDTALKYGVVEQSSDFFSTQNITNLLTGADQGIQRIDTLGTSADKLTDTEQVRTRLEANREFLDNAYGLAKEVRAYVVNQTNQNLFDCCFINRGSLTQNIGIVKNNSELNENIRQYQEHLLRKMVDYFNHIRSVSSKMALSPEEIEALDNPRLYEVVEGVVQNTGILKTLDSLVKRYLSATDNFKPDILRQLYMTANDSTQPQEKRRESQRKLDAYNANVILTHFDTYLSLTLGKAIEIKDFNQKTGENKYQISGKTSSLATTWRTSEDIDVESEADAITKLAINTTPLFNYTTGVQISGQYLHFSDFEHTIAKIKDLTYREDVIGTVFNDEFIDEHYTLWESLTPETREFLRGKSLSQAINSIRRNPRQVLSSIFEILTNEEFRGIATFYSNNDFTDDELNKLYSISRGIFNPKYEESLYSLSGQEFDTDYYSYITQTVDSIFKVSYVQYFRDQDGFTQVRTLIDQSINNIRRGIEQTINTSNSIGLIKDPAAYYRSLNLEKNPEETFTSITYIIPGTPIKAKVTASSGTVTFIDTRTDKAISNFQELWKDENIRQYIDSVLRIGIATDSDFQNALKSQESSYSSMCKNLLSFAARVTLNQYVSNEMIQGKSNAEKETLLNSIYGKGAPKYNYALDELGLVHGNDIPTLKNIAIAKANVSGVTTASQVKDGEGNGQSLQTLSRLLGSLQSQFDLQEKQPWSATNEAILLTVPGLFEGVFTAKEFHNQTGDNKASTAMGVSEMAYAGIVQDFIGGIMKREDGSVVGNGHVLFLPSVNSDKGTIGRLKINLNKEVTLNGETKAIIDLSPSELEALIAREFGTIYSKMYTAITDDWTTLENFIRGSVPQIPNLAQSYLKGFADFNLWWSSNREALKQYGKSPAAFIKYFTLQYNRTHRLNPLSIIDQVHYKNNKGNLGINQAFISQIARFNPQFLLDLDPKFNLSVYPTGQQFWATKKAEILKGLLKSRFRVNTTATTQPELTYIRNQYPTWINDSGDMILGKAVIDGQNINITSNRDLARLQEQLKVENVNDLINLLSSEYSLQLNPILEQYNYLDYLFTQEFMCATVGSFIAHPEKSKSKDVLQQEAAHFQAQHKRNVSFTAAMHAFQLNLLNGIPEEYNIAVIDDIADEQGTILGLDNGIKPFDGATFVNPFVVILENNSLGGARAGITKKQFVHFKNERTGTGGIIKTAGFGLTNDWIRNSPFLERMMRKMTDHVWLNQDGTPAIVDITTDYKGNKIKFQDSFFKVGNRIFKIEEIQSLGNNTYQRTIREVGEDGAYVSTDIITEAPVVIDTNYKLWNFFGGKMSMTMEGRFLKLSNTSVENVVEAMNNVGTPIGNPARIETQDQLWQPLKQVDVHYIPTAGAVKQGAANINSADKYHNDEDYDTQRIKMYQAGIQLDKEHHADDSELSLMTQVIGACSAKGYTLEAAIGLYDALRKSTEIGTREHLDAVKALFQTGADTSQDLQAVIMKAIVNALGTSQGNGGNFAEIIASDLIRQAREGKAINFAEALLPLSDNTVYSKIFSIISSYLTNAGIKQKIPGILSVLTPSHNIFKIYAGRKYESFINPEQELEELQSQQIPIYDTTDPNSISNLELGRSYRITRLLPTGYNEQGEPLYDPNNPNIDTKTELIRTPSEYHRLKQDIAQGTVLQVVEDVTVGRDLAAYNVRFNTTDGSRFQLWDLDSATALFEWNEIKDKKGDLSPEELLATVSSFYQKYFGTVPSNLDMTNVDAYLTTAEIRLRRLLQNDLMNLSNSTPALNRQYQELLNSNDGTQAWYSKFAQWVNIKLGRDDGSELVLGGVRTPVNASTFGQIEPRVRQMLATTTKVRIGGQYFDVDKSSVMTQAYELIMPKTFATNFGLKEFDDLNTIKNDRDFFIKQYLRNQATKVNENQYTVELKTSDGNHYYLLTKKQAVGSDLTKVDNILTMVIDGRTYRVDSNGNTMYELTKDTEVYTDGLGHDILVTDDLGVYIESLHYDTIKLSSTLSNYPSIVDSILKDLKKSKKKQAKDFRRFVTSQGENPTAVMQYNAMYHELTLDNYENADPKNAIIKTGREKHTSFLRSLDIVAARIPAQSMQSFMPMKVVAYDNPDINTAHVSTMQILLQGSDFDVDAVSLATFDIDRNGLLQLWSPYANIESVELMEASLGIPIPSGQQVSFQEVDSIEGAINFLSKYQGTLFNISKALVYNKETKNWDTDRSSIGIDMTLDTVDKINLFIEFLQDIQSLQIPSRQYLQQFAFQLSQQGIISFRPDSFNQVEDIFNKLKRIADDHNMYFDNLSKYNLSKVVNNYTMFSMYRTIADPVNLIQAQTSVDGTTGPLKKEANKSSEAKEASTRTPGNFVNKYESITENQVGKEAIGICATGLKAFFGLTQYNNYILNYGTAEQQENLLLGKEHRGVMIGNKVYRTVANIRSKDPNSITNADVLEALASVTNDNDAALVLSALLSLATDNAKELTLSKLNAGTKMIGMYIYGITIGMDFKDVAKILMSDVGTVIKGLLDNDVFSGRDGYGQMGESLFKYFDKGPSRMLNRFRSKKNSDGQDIKSPLEHLTSLFEANTSFRNDDGEPLPFAQALVLWSRSNLHLSEKLNLFEEFRRQYSDPSKEARELYNQLIDFVQDYIQQGHVIGLNEATYADIKKLAEGAEEMKILGRILSLNQGIKTNPDGLLAQVNHIERAVYKETGDLEDLIDLTKFAFDEAYREQCIAKYEIVKHAFNILDVASKVPHFMGYVQTLATAAKEVQNSFKFRSSKELSLQLSKDLGVTQEDKIIRGVQNYVGDYLRKKWMRSKEVVFIIPKGNKAFDRDGNPFELTEDTPIQLGTDWGDATFRMWFENEIIPNLKQGIIKPGAYSTELIGNKFITDLGNDLLTNTVSRNPTVVYTLPINMLPRIDQERAIFNRYKSEFNRLASLGYQYEVSSYNSETGEVTTELTEPTPLVDLFTYYAMIANSWKLSEKSLVPILEDFQNSGIIQEFHNFETVIDQSGEVLSLDNIVFNDLLPYIAPFDSPYSSFSTAYIQYRNPSTRKYQLMRLLSRQEQQQDNVDTDTGVSLVSSSSRIKDYTFEGGGVDTNYFLTGRVESSERTVKHTFKDGDTDYQVEVVHDVDSWNVINLRVNGETLEIPELTTVPTIKKNGVKDVNMALLESIIKSKLNPC